MRVDATLKLRNVDVGTRGALHKADRRLTTLHLVNVEMRRVGTVRSDSLWRHRALGQAEGSLAIEYRLAVQSRCAVTWRSERTAKDCALGEAATRLFIGAGGCVSTARGGVLIVLGNPRLRRAARGRNSFELMHCRRLSVDSREAARNLPIGDGGCGVDSLGRTCHVLIPRGRGWNLLSAWG
jgi:hypothetical protein